ncbi:MAG: transposase [Bacteroidetes bacterium]|nr:transposase [Bacteroidota bacterium]
MENTITARKIRKRYTAEEIQSFLDQWQSSGQSTKTFCQEHNLGYYAFCSWKKRSNQHPKKVTVSPSAFVPLKVKQARIGTVFAEINFSNGNQLTVYSSVPAIFLKNILR